MNIDDMIGNDKMHSFCLPVESCVVCGDRASGKLICILKINSMCSIIIYDLKNLECCSVLFYN